MHPIASNLLYSYTRVLGVEAVLKDNDEISFNICLLQKKKNQLAIIDAKENCALADLLTATEPVSLNISGNGVLIKITDLDGRTEIGISELLPSSKAEDFYVSSYYSNGKAYSFIVRRSEVTRVLDALKEVSIVRINVGAAALIGATEALFANKEKLTADSYILLKNAKNDYQIYPNEEKEQDNYLVSDQEISSSLIGAFSSSFDLFIHPDNNGYIQNEATKANQSAYFHKNLFGLGLRASLGIFLTILLVNFILFSMQSSTNEILKAQIMELGTGYQKTDSMMKELENKKSFLKTTGWLDNSIVSYYSDQLALTRPPAIGWTELMLYPKQKNEDESFTFQNNIIRIKGVTGNAYDLNLWQQTLRKLKWVKSVQLESLKKNEEVQVSNFSLTLEIK